MKADKRYFSDDEWQHAIGGYVPPDWDIKNKELLEKLTESEILEWLKTQATKATSDNKP
jgi:hypothetical protein